jgi:hypothetical protein
MPLFVDSAPGASTSFRYRSTHEGNAMREVNWVDAEVWINGVPLDPRPLAVEVRGMFSADVERPSIGESLPPGNRHERRRAAALARRR